MNVKFPVWIKYKKGFYSLFRLVMNFGCYYCHVLRDSFSDVVKHSSSVHEFDKLKIRSRELNVITGKIGYRTHNFNIILNEIKVNCFVFHVLIEILSRVHLLHIPSFFIGNFIHISRSIKEVSGCF